MTWFDQTEFERLRLAQGVTWGRPVRALSQTTSTNDEALAAIASDALSGIVWIAREQTQGRGRRGNHWVAPAGDCLMLSALLRHPGPPERMLGLSLVVGLAVRDLVSEVFAEQGIEKDACIKWPNDVYVEGKKLAGILIETRFDKSGQLGVVLGLGLNVHTLSFPNSLPDATSLRMLGVGSSSLGYETLLAGFLRALEKRVSRFLTGGISRFIEELNERDALRGKSVRVGDITGQGVGMDEGGRLLLETEGGKTVAIETGHVELLR